MSPDAPEISDSLAAHPSDAGDAHSVLAHPAFSFFPSAVVTLQKQGTVTIPPEFRPATHDASPLRLWLRMGPHDSLWLEPLWDPMTLFTRHDSAVALSEPLATAPVLPTRWLDTLTVLQAQAHPDHPARA